MSDFDAHSLPQEKVLCDSGDVEAFAAELEQVGHAFPRRIDADPEKVEKGLTKLVLIVLELLRRLLEHQALRRIEGGSLSDAEIERLGQTFMKLESRMEELKRAFGLEDEDLNLHLGPLGDLL